jgi:trichothecene 3-O-acetyltransferase
MAEQHVYHLSTIDQSLGRKYIRYALCFPCEDSQITTVVERLNLSVQRAITHLPILAGIVVPKTENKRQQGQQEVQVSLDAFQDFRPSFTNPEYPYTYEELIDFDMPAIALFGKTFTLLPDSADAEASPVLAVQANFIHGGLILVFYLHHSVVDLFGLATLLRQMSTDLPTRKLSNEDLRHDALQQSRLRDRLSGSRGVPPDVGAQLEYNREYTDEIRASSAIGSEPLIARIFNFDLQLIEETKNILNARVHYLEPQTDHFVKISNFNVLAAILWKGVARACRAVGTFPSIDPIGSGCRTNVNRES